MVASTPSSSGVVLMNGDLGAGGAPAALMANALRVLSVDMIERAGSGHPGLPLGAADIVTVLFATFLKFDPEDPQWPDRDRFVLSAGHGSALLYALHHCMGTPGMDIEALKNFRQLSSNTPGHPEYGCTVGVEMTTGPLGQGLSSAVGMALAERLLAEVFGRDIVDHFTYVLVSDGDLMEGISHEAVGLAGNMGLGRLIVLCDANGISIDGPLSLSDSTDHVARFRAANWDAWNVDGHSHSEVGQAIAQARQTSQPSLIVCRTHIGYGAPHKQDSAAAHGAPLGASEVEGLRDVLRWPHPPFAVPDVVYEGWRAVKARSKGERLAWQKRVDGLPPGKQREFKDRLAKEVPSEVWTRLRGLKAGPHPTSESTRKASGRVLSEILPVFPHLLGGSADLSNSTCTRVAPHQTFVHYGVREHGMAACMNGLALHGGFIPYGGTFLVFSDYLRPALRLSTLMKQQVIYVMTHDSIGLGEDGPTHQPIEHLASLRCMPDLYVFRPADSVETIECWQAALNLKSGPSVLVLTRQDLPLLRGRIASSTPVDIAGDMAGNRCWQGAYEISPAHSARAAVTLLAAGSEVSVAVDAQGLLQEKGIPTRVVSMPCWRLFEQQSCEARELLLGPSTLRFSVEASCRFGWDRYITSERCSLGLDRFGASAPAPDLYNHFSMTAARLAQAVREELER